MLRASLLALLLLGTAPVHADPLLGQQDVTVLVVDLTGMSDSLLMSDAQLAIDELSFVLDENSGGRAWFNFDVIGPIHLPASVCDPTTPGYDERQQALLEAAIAQVDPWVDFSQVHQIAMLAQTDTCVVGNSGHPRRIWPFATADGPLDSSYAIHGQFVGSRPSSWIMLHEYAHTVGAIHNEPVVCTDQQRIVVDHSPYPTHGDRCVLAPPWYTMIDPMNGGWFHFSAVHKVFWGWFDPGALVEVTATSTHTIVATESDAPGPRFLRIPLPGSHIYRSLLVEYRSATDTITPFPSAAPQRPGVYVYASRDIPGFALGDLLEPEPFASQTEFTTRPLSPGVPLVDPQLGIQVMLVAEPDKSGARVFVLVPRCEKDCTVDIDEPPIDELAPPGKHPRPPHVDLGEWPKILTVK